MYSMLVYLNPPHRCRCFDLSRTSYPKPTKPARFLLSSSRGPPSFGCLPRMGFGVATKKVLSSLAMDPLVPISLAHTHAYARRAQSMVG